MGVLGIRIYGDPALKKKCGPVAEIDQDIAGLAADMAGTMYLNNGVGLAASQVGVSKKVIIIDISEERNNLIALINPEVIGEEGEETAEEGCLSLPGVTAEVTRSRKVNVKALNLEGEEVKIEGEGRLARVLLHEIDHLNGVLFVDRIGNEKKRELAKELKELRRLAKKETTLL